MNKFIFITHLTPKHKRSVLREQLIGIYYHALKNQTYSDWKVILFGEPEDPDPRFHYLPLPDVARAEKAKLMADVLTSPGFLQIIEGADYLIKLDDDDIISASLLERLKQFNGDLYFDEYHTFTDISSGQVTQQKRNWIASTCVHRLSCALDKWEGSGATETRTLLYSDHNKAWHEYYRGKKCTAAPKQDPCYLRVLSPTSITSSQRKQSEQEIDLEKYHAYLRSFGDWEPAAINGFESYMPMLSSAWKRSMSRDQTPLRSSRQNLFMRGLRKMLRGLRPNES